MELRQWFTRKHVVVACCFVMLGLLGCAGSNFKKATAANTVGAYDAFLSKYGDSEYAAEARRLRDRQAFLGAKYWDTIAAYRDYIRENPSGNYLQEAATEIKRIQEEVEQEEAVVARIQASRSAREQAILLAHASGKFALRLRNNSYLRPYFQVLDNVWVTARDIVVTRQESDCSSLPLLGTLCTDYLYTGKVLRNEIVYVTDGGSRIRTFNRERDLVRFARDPGDYKLSNWAALTNSEAFGETQLFKQKERLSGRDLFHRNFGVNFAETFYPTKFAEKSTSGHGGLVGFIQDHPIMSLVIGAAAVSMLSHDASVSSGSSASSSSGHSSPSGGNNGLTKLLSCAGQSMAGKLIENPAAAAAIAEALRASMQGDEYSLRGASESAAKNYISGKLRRSGNDEAANLVEAGDFLFCAIKAWN